MPWDLDVTAISAGKLCIWSGLAALGAWLVLCNPALAQAPGLGIGAELVDPHVFRVCADPHDLPFSNQAKEGFENQIAGIIAKDLGKKLGFTWQPQVFGFLRTTLYSYRCDVVMGITQGATTVGNSNAYYRSAYALIFRSHSGFDGIQSLEDPRLKGKRIGIIAGTPPATILAEDNLLDHIHSYELSVNTRYFAPARNLVQDLEQRKIDIGILWGPIAGYFASRSHGTLAIVPLLHESSDGPPMEFSIVMGVRSADDAWRRTLNAAIARSEPEITRILKSFGVPLLDPRNNVIYAGG